VKRHYASLASQSPALKLILPRFVIHTAFKTEMMKNYLNINDIEDCIEKPIPFNQLREMIREQTK
jgi:hypothetical protein